MAKDVQLAVRLSPALKKKFQEKIASAGGLVIDELGEREAPLSVSRYLLAAIDVALVLQPEEIHEFVAQMELVRAQRQAWPMFSDNRREAAANLIDGVGQRLRITAGNIRKEFDHGHSDYEANDEGGDQEQK